MAYTLYIHEPLGDLPDLAQYGFSPGSFFWTELDDAVEDALYEAEAEGIPHVLIQVEAPEEVLEVREEDVLEALAPSEEDDYEEVPEDFVEEEFEEGASVEVVYEEEFVEEQEILEEEELVEEEALLEEGEIREEDLPKTLPEAILLTESATLTKRLGPQEATVLGEPFEFVQEELSPEELDAGVWFGFGMEPTPLVSFLTAYWRRWFKRLFRSRR